VKCSNAKDDWASWCWGRVWFSLCVPNHRDFTEFDLQRIPYWDECLGGL